MALVADAYAFVPSRRPSGAAESFGWDGLGRRVAFTNAAGRVTRFGFDGAGRPLAVTNALGQAARNEYDAAGNLVHAWDFTNGLSSFQYDALSRMTNASYPGGVAVALAYDANGNVVRASRGGVVETFGWDALNRMAAATTTVGNVAWTLRLERDRAGNVTNLVYPGGVGVACTYDAEDRIETMRDWSGRQFGFAYYDCGWLQSVSYPNDVTATPVVDALGQWTEISVARGGTALGSRSIARDDLGRKTVECINAGLGPAPPPWRRVEAAHDAADRLTSAVQYDGTNLAATVTYAYGPHGEVARGVTVSNGQTRTVGYAWTGDGRLGAVTNAAGSVRSFVYSASGALVGRVGAGVTNWIAAHPGSGLPLAEINAAGTVTRRYVWGPGGLLAFVEADGTLRCCHSDDMGSVIALTDAAGAVTDQFAWSPHGDLAARTGATTMPLAFLGSHGVWTEEAGLLRMGARWYDAGLRRFLSPDPMGIDGGFNLYAYADADPANRVDPLGLCAQSSSRGIVDNVRYAPDREYDGRLGYVARTQGFAAAAVLGISDFLGLSAIGEFYTGRDFSTGKYLSAGEQRGRAVQAVLTVAAYAFSMVRIAPAARAAPAIARTGGNSVSRFFHDSRSFRQVSGEYWATRGPADGRSLHHWLIPQRATRVPQGIRNAGFNLVELPAMQGAFHHSLGLNQWMGFARNWGPEARFQASLMENTIRIGIPAAGAGAGYLGYQAGSAIYDAASGDE